MQFSEVLASIGSEANQTLHLPEGWNQGRALFGGLTAGITYQHALNGVNPNQQVRALTISFVGPLAAGKAQLKRRILREGKNVTQVSIEIEQDNAVMLSALVTFGLSRPSAVKVTDTPTAKVPPREQGPAFPRSKLSPEFTNHYDYRVSVGGMPFSNNPSREFGGWMRYSQEDSPIDIGLFLGLVDAWPPAVLPHLDAPAPASSLTWTIEFPEPLPTTKRTSDWWQYVAYIDYAADGYGHTHSHIWDNDGKLVAISRQTVTVFG
ncbi:thioesterase family protein [Aliidiomarina shirensis]|uniref:Thioesterase family protein n=1 Tax=Aliidiomarina shirensis TaxID=1048642 RepID=A0A432WSU8_9GAMM|nr:thioesterase family protein [Aliidiomarina shirensis]RUO36851.1 thioesterase family protein [Aliidiomarina shirensis]